MARYLLGIDLGTSNVRAGIFHEDGTLFAIATRSYPIDTPSLDRAEQDPEIWWKHTCETIGEALATAQLKGTDISGISFSGQMHGTVLLDNDGNLVAPAIIWADSRSSAELNELTDLIGEEKFNKSVLNRMFPGTQAATIYWMQKYDRDTWKRTRHILLPKDYIRYRMCGLYNTEPSDASATLLFDINLREWSNDILNALGIPIEFMPYVVNSNQYIGETEGIEESTGIPDGIPVILGGADQPVAALGNGILDDGTMFAAIGTGGQIVTPLSMPMNSPGLRLNLFCHLPESRWYLMGATLAAGLCLRWYRDNFCPETAFEVLSEEASQTPPGADGLQFLPYLAGRRSPDMNPATTGAFSGIRLMHTRGHFARAIMEGVVLELKELFEVMKETGIKPTQLVASGGFSKSPVWMQIMADSFAMPLHISAVREQACFGAALLAGLGTGVYDSYWKAAELVPEPEKIVEPEEENFDIYEEKFEKYKTAYKNLKKIEQDI